MYKFEANLFVFVNEKLIKFDFDLYDSACKS